MEEPKSYPSLSISAENDALIAHLEPSTGEQPIDATQLQQLLADRQLDALELNATSVDRLICAAQHNQSFSLDLLSEPAAGFELKISDDKMSVTAESKSDSPQSYLSVAELKAQLLALGVDATLILEDALTSFVKDLKPTVVAQGRPAINGEPTQFEPCFSIDRDLGPAIDEADIAHYYDTKQYVTVEIGAPLLRRIPPTAAADGITVMGKAIKAKPGKALQFKKLPGSIISETDENLLLAQIKGHPVLEPQGVRVDQTLELKNASLDSGSIHFDGSVQIHGDVLPQVCIVATGDLFVKGTVENAKLLAGHNIVIGGGVISEAAPDKDQPPKITTQISANGDVHAKFLNLTRISAGGSIFVQSYILHCDLRAEQTLVIGEKGGKGALIGGKSHVDHSVTANTLGSSAYIATEIECGTFPQHRQAIAALESVIAKRSDECRQLQNILEKIKDDPAPVVGELTINRRTRINKVIASIEASLVELTESLEAEQALGLIAQQAFVQAKKNLYPQVSVKLQDLPYLEQVERPGTKLTFKNGEIQIQ